MHRSTLYKKRKTIHKSFDVNVPASKVWEILFDDKYFSIWGSEFSAGSHVFSNWKVDSNVVYKDGSGNGLFGHVVENVPNEVMRIKYEGELVNNQEERESDDAKAMHGAYEVYKFSENNGMTHVEIEADMLEHMFDEMSVLWDRAIIRIKELAETS